MSKEEDLEKLDIEYSLFEVDKIDSIDEVNGLSAITLYEPKSLVHSLK